MFTRSELQISNTTGDWFAVHDADGDLVLELPKEIARTEAGAKALLDWLVPICERSFSAGKIAGKAELSAALRTLLYVPSIETIVRIDKEIYHLHSGLSHLSND
jgi:hypothetical protein